MTTPAHSYRFKFAIVDETTGDVVQSDFTYLTDIDEFGRCESVDIHVAAMLRAFRRDLRAEAQKELAR